MFNVTVTIWLKLLWRSLEENDAVKMDTLILILNFNSAAPIPRHVKGPYQLDKWKLPSFRTSMYDKANFFVS
ncbi:hypothetical protein H5410_057220 [Solanum commersonii]|uniref:Uncharacterized protein n=1 Tax=Solanum commersonii TaxID=4109 RepID=A0A9J5WQ90_SOLCO|nr:hypothetical protein H5410_057220 [Solanum commersonii]